MATLKYVGRAPDSDSTIVPKSYADSQNANLSVTTTIVNNIIAAAAVNLTDQTYVDAQDALRAHKNDVTAADNLYVALSALGAAGGVASLDGSGNIPAGQIPAGVRTDRVAACYSVAHTGTLPLLGGTPNTTAGAIGTINLASGVTHTVSTTTVREYQLASIVIPDPGFPWKPLPFAWVQGNSSSGTNPGTRQSGNGNYGLLTCMPPSGVSDTVYGLGLCTASYVTDTYAMTPYAATNQTHTSVPAINGSLELDLYGCLWSGTTYTFVGTNLNFLVLVLASV